MDGYAIVAADTAGAREATRSTSASSATSRPALRPTSTVDAGHRRPDRDRRAPPGRRRRSRPGRVDRRRSTRPARRSARARRHRPGPGRVPGPRACGGRRLRPHRRQRPRRRRDAPRTGHSDHGGRGGAPRRCRRRRRSVVHRRPRVAVLATGDEVRAPGRGARAGRDPRRQRPWAARPGDRRPAPSPSTSGSPRTTSTTSSPARRGLDAGADAIIVSGGVSVGPYDVVKTAIETIGRIDLWRVAVQPGKPFAFGTAPRPGGWQAHRSCCSGCPATRSRPRSPSSSSSAPRIRAMAGRHGPPSPGRSRGPRRGGHEERRPTRVHPRRGRPRRARRARAR